MLQTVRFRPVSTATEVETSFVSFSFLQSFVSRFLPYTVETGNKALGAASKRTPADW
jgi:hypothetical protein